MRAHPAMVSGTRRDERALLTAIPGAIGKAGAESCYAVALPDGRAFALKTDDGAMRARPVVMAAALARSGVDVEPGVDTEAVRATGVHTLLGGGEPVGVVRATFWCSPGCPWWRWSWRRTRRAGGVLWARSASALPRCCGSS